MKRGSRGFSLIETLVVITVILILFASLLSAVLTARDASRRARCVSNLKQIGLALHGYHAARNCYPYGATPSLNPMSTSGAKVPGQVLDWSGWSPQSQLLPYLQQASLYNAINFDFDPFINLQEPMNTTAHSWKVDLFLCPADPYAGKPNLNNYYASLGTNFQSPAHQTTGVFAYQTIYSERDVTDGVANTVAFAEGLSGDWRPRRYRGNGVVNTGVKDADPMAVNRLTAETAPKLLMQNLKACNDLFDGVGTVPAAYSASRGQYWSWGTDAMSLFNTLVPPNSTQYAFNQCRYDCKGCFVRDADHSDITNASSYHPGGANALFCDGSVRFIKGSMALPTWWALGTKSGGETVSGENY